MASPEAGSVVERLRERRMLLMSNTGRNAMPLYEDERDALLAVAEAARKYRNKMPLAMVPHPALAEQYALDDALEALDG